MKKSILLLQSLLFLFAFYACLNEPKTEPTLLPTEPATAFVAQTQAYPSNTIANRFTVPEGFVRNGLDTSSFGYFLRFFPLKPAGTKVKYYDGRTKQRSFHSAVLDIDTGKKDLQQCADAVMRLRAEWLFSQKIYDDISFDFVNGFKADYVKWRQGYRIKVEGNIVTWVKNAEPSASQSSFRKYMDVVFMYASTLSLEKQLQPVDFQNVTIGDVFIHGGSPGHAIIVMDVVENEETAEKRFLLAQSYMPAQDIHVLTNVRDEELSPWYSTLSVGTDFITPEWSFTKKDLKRFPNFND